MPENIYSNRVRVRVNGLLVENRKLLLVKIHQLTLKDHIWMPPGGGVDFGESLEDALKREFIEETGVEIQIGTLRYIHEFIKPPLHALEFYYDCKKVGGALKLGHDPELIGKKQILEDVRFMKLDELDELPIAPAYLREHFRDEFDELKCIPKVISS